MVALHVGFVCRFGFGSGPKLNEESAEQLSDHDREILEKFAQRELHRILGT
jgi:hypothetical protein